MTGCCCCGCAVGFGSCAPAALAAAQSNVTRISLPAFIFSYSDSEVQAHSTSTDSRPSQEHPRLRETQARANPQALSRIFHLDADRGHRGFVRERNRFSLVWPKKPLW